MRQLLSSALLMGFLTLAATIAEARSKDPATWRVAQAPGIEILTAASPEKTREVVEHTFRLRSALAQAFPEIITAPPGELQLVIVEDSRQFMEFLPTVYQQRTIIATGWSASPFLMTVVVNLDRERLSRSLDYGLGAIALIEATGNQPVWVSDGFGGAISGTRVDRGFFQLATVGGESIERVAKDGPVSWTDLFGGRRGHRSIEDLPFRERIRGTRHLLIHHALLGNGGSQRQGFAAMLKTPRTSDPEVAAASIQANLGLDESAATALIRQASKSRALPTVRLPLASLAQVPTLDYREVGSSPAELRALRAQVALAVAPGDAGLHLSQSSPRDGLWRAAVAALHGSIAREQLLEPAWVELLQRTAPDPEVPAYVSLAAAEALMGSTDGPLTPERFQQVLTHLRRHAARTSSLQHRNLLRKAVRLLEGPAPDDVQAELAALATRHPLDRALDTFRP